MVKTWIFTVVAQVQFLFWRLRSHIKLLHVVAKKRKEKKKKTQLRHHLFLKISLIFTVSCNPQT